MAYVFYVQFGRLEGIGFCQSDRYIPVAFLKEIGYDI